MTLSHGVNDAKIPREKRTLSRQSKERERADTGAPIFRGDTNKNDP
jgi:hypothetical protein